MGQGHLPEARHVLGCWRRLQRRKVRRYLSRPPRGRQAALRRQGREWVRRQERAGPTKLTVIPAELSLPTTYLIPASDTSWQGCHSLNTPSRTRCSRLPRAAEVEKAVPDIDKDKTVDSQVINLKASGADVFFNVTIPKFAAQAIRKAAEIGWKPTHILNSVSNSVGSVLKPAGLDNSQDILRELGTVRPGHERRRRQVSLKRCTADRSPPAPPAEASGPLWASGLPCYQRPEPFAHSLVGSEH